jgi:uncharacterized protein YgbK (DUF1537 family)
MAVNIDCIQWLSRIKVHFLMASVKDYRPAGNYLQEVGKSRVGKTINCNVPVLPRTICPIGGFTANLTDA